MTVVTKLVRLMLGLPKEINYKIQKDKCPYEGELRHDCENCVNQLALPLCAYEDDNTS
jgi:hypothetical protein